MALINIVHNSEAVTRRQVNGLFTLVQPSSFIKNSLLGIFFN